MVRSCLVLLVCYALLWLGYAWWLGGMFDPPGQYIGAAVVALIVGGSLGALYNALVAYREWSLVAAAERGMPWSDGRWSAVVGEIHPVAEPLKAPFSGETCVMCEYDVTSRKRADAANKNDNNTPGSDFTGFLMNPCVVRGQTGDVRLLGFPNLVGFGERICDGARAVENAREFLTNTPLEDFSGIKLVTIFSAIKAAWSDDDGFVRKNLRLGKTLPESLFSAGPTQSTIASTELPDEDEADLDEEDEDEVDEDEDFEGLDDNSTQCRRGIPLLKEKRVKVGEKVCAIGIYSGERRGLVPGGLGADCFIKLIRGKGPDIERRARSSVFGHFFGGVIALVVVHVAALGVMLAARYDSKQLDARKEEAFQIVRSQDGNVARLAKLIARGVDMNAVDGQGRTLLGASQNPAATLWLKERGANANPTLERAEP